MKKISLNKKMMSAKTAFAVLFCIAAIVSCVCVAYAGGIADIIYSILGVVVSFVADIIINLLQLGINFILQSMAVSLTEMQSWDLFSGFENFTEGIRLFAVAIASVAILWQLFAYFFGPFLGNKQEVSVTTLFIRTLIFVPLTYVIQDFALIVFGEFQKIYIAFLNGTTIQSGTVSLVVDIAGQINQDTFLSDMTTGSAALEALFDYVTIALRSVLSIIVSSLFLILILWNLVKLVLEIAQRFAAMLVYAYLSPLAAAAGVIGNGEILKRAFVLFMSSGVLWVLNVWCVSVAVSLINKIGIAIAHGMAGTFAWAFLCYGFLKVVQQLDDIFNAVGATNVQFRGSILDDILSIRTLTGNAASKAFDYVKGKMPLSKNSPDNPTGPRLSNGLGGQQKGGTPTPSTAKGGTANPTPSNAEKLDNLLNKTQNRDDANAALHAMYKNNPGVFNEPEVKDMIGKKQLGLNPNSQKVLGTQYGGEGDLSAVVASAKNNGSVQLSKVDGIADTKANAPHGTHIEANTMSTGKNGANRVNDFAAAGGTAGKEMATMSYTDGYGNVRTAQVESMGTDKSGNAKFALHSDSGGVSNYVAPAGTTATEFAAAVNGSASPELMAKFEQHEKAHPHGSNGSGCYSSAQKYIRADSDKGGSVFAGTAMENSPNTSVTHASPSGDVTWQRMEHGASGTDTWSASVGGKEVGRVSVPSDTGAASIAFQAHHSDAADFANIRNAVGITEADNPAVTFTPNPSSTGPEPMRDRRGIAAPGQKEDGSEWKNYGFISPETGENGESFVNMGYHVLSDNPNYAGKQISERATLTKSGSYEQDGETYTTFEVKRNSSNGSAETVSVKGDYTPEQIAPTLYSKEKSSTIEGAENLRSALGIEDDYDKDSVSDIEKLLKVAGEKKKRRSKTSHENPAQAESESV